MANTIPPITDPLGSAWNQPATDQILIDDKYAVMKKDTLDSIAVYNTSLPSGKYIGKMWRCRHKLCWYVKHEDPNLLGIEWRVILVME